MSDFKRVLLLGTGPASIQLALHLKKHWNCTVAIVGRESVRSECFFEALKQSNQRIRVSIQNEKHRYMEGECFVDHVFQGYGTITGEWDTVIFAVTTDAYIQVLNQIASKLLEQVNCMLLISPTFGSNSLVRHYMNDINPDVEIISFSSYFGDTRWIEDKPTNHVLTTAIKKKVFIGSTKSSSANVVALCTVYEQSGIVMVRMDSPIEAETRNISLYVHPPLFMNAFALNAIFEDKESKKYVYKIYPEGPITQF